MNLHLEFKKIKRTGILPAFFGGSILTAAVPVINMTVRTDMYLQQQGTPVEILLRANWQMMAMLNILLIVAGACLLYHTEYADNAIQKMKSLPIRESAMFFGKAILIMLLSFFILVIEAGAIVFCSCHWFETGTDFFIELCKSFGYAFLLMQPCIILSLLISEIFRNMWVSLGIGVICVFTATMLPADSYVLSLFPFATPFQMFACTDTVQVLHYICAVTAELVIFSLAELMIIKIRRCFS